MARRTVSGQDYQLDSDGNPPWFNVDEDGFRPDPRDYVSVLIDGSPFERLLWREIRHIEKYTQMTEWQQAVFECYLRGLTNVEIAVFFHRDESTIRQHLSYAQAKAETFPNRGLLTTMIETLGWRVVGESLADKLEARLRSRARRN